MDGHRQGNNERKKMKQEWQRKRRWEEEKEHNLRVWLLQAELLESDTSPCGWHMEPIVAAAQQGKEHRIRRGVAGSDSLYTGKARLMELKDDTDVSLWPSQPSVTGNWPSHRLAPSCGESGRRIVMTSHYELGAVLSTWPTTKSTVPALVWTKDRNPHVGLRIHVM